MKYSLEVRDLIGKTIKNIEVISAEYGRTYHAYLCFTCEDGARVMLHGGKPCSPNPTLESMQKVTFFTPDEIAEKAKWDEIRRRQKIEAAEEHERMQYERLRKKFGE